MLLRDPRSDREGESLLEERGDLRDDVVVVRRGLHRARLSLHVHQAEIGAGVSDDARELRLSPQRRHVIDHHGAECERATPDLRARGVDRHAGGPRAAPAPGAPAGARRPARRGPNRAGSTLRRHRRGPPRRRASPRRLGCLGRRAVRAAVREAVGRDVDDAHHGRPLPTIGHRPSSHPAWTLTRAATAGRRGGHSRSH